MKRLHAVIAMVALIMVLSAIGCSSKSEAELAYIDGAEAELAFNDGSVSLEQGLYAEAISHFDKAIQLDLAFAMAYNYRGLACQDLGQHQRAIEDYDKAYSARAKCPALQQPWCCL